MDRAYEACGTETTQADSGSFGLIMRRIDGAPSSHSADEEIGRLALFLASGAADYLTGATYVMDGGLMQMCGQGA
jgi:NAD(P)-dependent dehydrogenase (short-subunit alcohol dehydrogenase family)